MKCISYSTFFYKRLFPILCFFPSCIALAATCAPAVSGGSAPSDWPSYCWLDFSTYNDATALSAAGQNFTINLTDGSVLTFNLKVSSTTAAGLTPLSITAGGVYSGAAVGNTAFLGIPNSPVLYTTTNSAKVTAIFSAINLIPPTGAAAASAYSFVAADAESTNTSESLAFTTNGSNWTVLDQVPPVSGATYPATINTGVTFTENGVAGTVGAYIVGTSSPTTVTSVLQAGGLQGAMFAVRFASVVLNKLLLSSRANTTDQFTYSILATTSGGTLSTATSTGTANGPFGAASVLLTSGLPVTIKEVMAAGSVSAITAYSPSLSCTNNNIGSTTSLPTNLNTTTYNFPSLFFGDAIKCNFTNEIFPILNLNKTLTNTRYFTGDQFAMNISNSGTVVSTINTTGAGTTATGVTKYQATVGQSYNFSEAASSTTVLSNYTSTMSCVNAFSSSATTLPNTVGGSLTPALGDNITCTIANTAIASRAALQIQKTVTVISDPINGTTNPKAIPGAVVQYSIKVTNNGTGTVSLNTVTITDPLPTQLILSVTGTPVVFTDGPQSSALTLSNANVAYTQAVGGNSAFTYTPVADPNGYDSLVTGLQINPRGTMAAANNAGALPSFTVQFLAKIK